VRFDMSEYMERHTVSRLIGAPPGYVGFDQGGLLTEQITKHPHCVLLLDEIEEGAPDVFNLLLQVMDHGTLTDNNGRKADFRHVVIVMTTNAGAADMARASIGFVSQDTAATQWRRSRNCSHPSSAIAWMRSCSSVGWTSARSSASWTSCWSRSKRSSRRRTSRCTSTTMRGSGSQSAVTTRRWVRDRWRRVIQEFIKRPLAEELLFGRLANGGHAFVSVGADGQLKVEPRSADEPALLE
jgi:ATP-dependent Clp protease ATP-binding subunit ClpA